MASFTVIATDLRRVTAKAPAGGFMIDILEDACMKLKVNSENYQLKHSTKAINLTDPVRAAGLPQGAKLELVVKSKSPSAVTVALRLPPSEARLGIANNRVAAKVRNDTPLWKLLRHLEEEPAHKQQGLNITGRGVPRTSTPSAGGSGQLYWEAPVIKFAGRELVSLDDFRKTLSQVGIDTGSQLVHLGFRITDMTLQEAIESVHRQLEREDATDAETSTSTSATVLVAPPAEPKPEPQEALAPEPAKESQDLAQKEQTEQPQPSQPPQSTQPPNSLRPVQVWSPPKAGTGMPAAAALRWARESSEAGSGSGAGGLAPTIAQMKAHQKHLEEAGRNKRLKSDTELQEETREREARAAAVDKVDVRIRFPDGYTVLWSFPNGATGATLHAAVREVLTEEAAKEPFRLVPPMSRDEIHDKADAKHDLVRGYGMRGGVVINFLRGSAASATAPTNTGISFVKVEITGMAQDIVVPQVGVDDDSDGNGEDEKAREAAAEAAEAAAKRKDRQGDAAKKMSKFLRLAKK